MLKNLTWLSKKLYILGIDWQFDTMHMMLLGCANKTNKSNRFNNLDHHKWLGQWRLSLPLLSASGALKVPAVWQKFTLELADLLGPAPLYINMGIPNQLCTWLHCPAKSLEAGVSSVKLQLYYQRIAAAALNIEPASLRVCQVQLAENLSFLVFTKRHYDKHIASLIISLHKVVKGCVVGSIKPQGLTQVAAPKGVNDTFAMAWFMAYEASVSR